MTRYKLAVLAFVLAGCIGCGGSPDGDGGSPTGPTGDGGGGTGSGGSGCTRPAAPGNFVATVSLNSVVFTWAGVGNAIDYSLLIGNTPSTSNVMSTNTSQTTYNWNGVNSGTYYARVEARNMCGSGASSSEVVFTIAS